MGRSRWLSLLSNNPTLSFDVATPASATTTRHSLMAAHVFFLNSWSSSLWQRLLILSYRTKSNNDRDSHLNLRWNVKNHDFKWQFWTVWIKKLLTKGVFKYCKVFKYWHYLHCIFLLQKKNLIFFFFYSLSVRRCHPFARGEQANRVVCWQLHSLKDNEFVHIWNMLLK